MKMFNCHVKYVAKRQMCKRYKYGVKGTNYRLENGTVRLMVMATDEADATAKTRDWFERVILREDAGIQFGTGSRDAQPGSIALAEKDAIAVFTNEGDVVLL